MGSFNTVATFSEYGDGAGGPYPVWPASTIVAEKERPNDTEIIQEVGADVERFNLVVRCTKAELLALYDQYQQDGSLVYHWETHNAVLMGIPSAAEQGAGKDVYLVTLDFIRLS